MPVTVTIQLSERTYMLNEATQFEGSYLSLSSKAVTLTDDGKRAESQWNISAIPGATSAAVNPNEGNAIVPPPPVRSVIQNVATGDFLAFNESLSLGNGRFSISTTKDMFNATTFLIQPGAGRYRCHFQVPEQNPALYLECETALLSFSPGMPVTEWIVMSVAGR